MMSYRMAAVGDDRDQKSRFRYFRRMFGLDGSAVDVR
jgi:hypothetical protein